MVTVDECIKYTIELARFDMTMVYCRIAEAYEKHVRNEKLTKQEKFLLGLRYSEFLATEDSNEGYYRAEMKRQACLRKLGLTCAEFNENLFNVCGLK